MNGYITRGRLKIAKVLYTFIQQQALPDTGIDTGNFWEGFEALLVKLTPANVALLAKRDRLQQQIDEYHRQQRPINGDAYLSFLKQIGYLLPDPGDVCATTENVDNEIATLAGPQLVVPINNARYALNAVNARWGSLYDALYGSDIISPYDGAEKGSAYNPVRGKKVIQQARKWLDTLLPLVSGSHAETQGYRIENGKLVVLLKNEHTRLADDSQWLGFSGEPDAPTSLLFCHQGLHFDLQFDHQHPIAQADPAGIKDIIVEAALTTIMDCEDSVAAVDADDKTLVYQNWLGLMKGDLCIPLKKQGQTLTRKMNGDRVYRNREADKEPLVLTGRSLMFIRNVGHLMRSNAILVDGEPVFEGLMDGVITALIGKHDLLGNGKYNNSRTGSIYIVKPKMHGPEEVGFANKLFSEVETLLCMAPNTLKMGVMDEERRTTINLKACIAAAASRVAFINTGFLDRTGDEIHTSMYAGVFAKKAELKSMPWIHAYEKTNVITGLNCNLLGRAQIGKGMWPIPDAMAAMMKAKIDHPKAGANTAWVPSPTAATLHALHYHQVDVYTTQKSLAKTTFDGLKDILTIPLNHSPEHLTSTEVQQEVDNNVQGILGYVVRWIHQGIGCSKVPDIENVGLMEDRATLRISSQHLANWLVHGVITASQVDDALSRMAALVDAQNANDPGYIPMTPDLEQSMGFLGARDLIFKGTKQPNGYTEPVLHARRLEMKRRLKVG